MGQAAEVLLRVEPQRGYGDDWDGNGYLVTNGPAVNGLMTSVTAVDGLVEV